MGSRPPIKWATGACWVYDMSIAVSMEWLVASVFVWFVSSMQNKCMISGMVLRIMHISFEFGWNLDVNRVWY